MYSASLKVCKQEESYELQFSCPDNVRRLIIVIGDYSKPTDDEPLFELRASDKMLLSITELTQLSKCLKSNGIDSFTIDYYAIVDSHKAELVAEHHLSRDERYVNESLQFEQSNNNIRPRRYA